MRNFCTTTVKYFLPLFFFLTVNQLKAQWQIGSINEEYIINFEESVPGVLNGQYQGTGFSATPAPGQLNSNAWSVTGLSGGDVLFGDEGVTGSFARGTADQGVSLGGIYAHPANGSSSKLMFQPDDDELNPGSIILKIQNNTGRDVDYIRTSFVYQRFNDQNNSTRTTFAVSDDDMLSWVDRWSNTTPVNAQANPNLTFTNPRHFTPVDLADGDYVYLRWTIEAISGTGERDEIFLDEFKIIMLDLDGYCLPQFSSITSGPGVSLFGLNNITNTSGINEIAYSDYTDQVINVVAGETYDLQLRTGFPIQNGPKAGVYADWNQDGVFDDPAENLTGVFNFPNNSIQTIPVTIPATADTGITRLRVVAVRNSTNNLAPCPTNVVWGEAEDYSINVFPAGSCLPPSEVNVRGHSSFSSTFEWQPGSNENSWDTELGEPGFAPGTGNETFANTYTSPNFNTLFGIIPGAQYDYYVRAACSSDTSDWVGPLNYYVPMVSTANSSIEEFNDTLPEQLTWFSIPDTAWTLGQGYIETEDNDGFFVSRAINVGSNHILRWDAKNATAGASNTYNVWATRSTYIHPDNFDILLGTFTTSSDQWEEIVLEIDSLNGERLFFAFEFVEQQTGSTPLNIDNIAIVPFVCNQVDSFGLLTPGAYEVVLEWFAPFGQNEWLIEGGFSGFTPGNEEEILTITVTDQDTVLIVGLDETTEYDFYIKTQCGYSGESSWKGPVNYTTICGWETPDYTVTIENAELPHCWTKARASFNDNSTITTFNSLNWGLADDYATISFTGQRFDYIISKAIDFGDGTSEYQLEFDIRLRTGNQDYPGELNIDETLQVRLSSNTNYQLGETLQFLFQNIEFVADKNAPPEWFWTRKVVNLSGYTGKQLIGFLASSSNTTFNSSSSIIQIKNFRVREVPACVEILNPFVDSVSSNSVHFTWDNPAEVNDWVAEYAPLGFTPGNGTVVSSNTYPFTIDNLDENTAYDIYFRAVCGSDSSEWTGPYVFRTVGQGDNCSNPIVVDVPGDLPFIDLNQSTYFRGDDYEQTTCLGFLGVGQDMIYQVDVTENIAVNIQWENNPGGASMAIMDQCPQSSICLYTVFSTASSFQREQFFTPGTYYIMLNRHNAPFYLRSFDFKIEVTPCGKPAGISLVEATSNSAILDWNHVGSIDSFVIEINDGSFTPGTGNALQTFNLGGQPPFEITGLNPATLYVAYIKSICGSEQSDWTGPFSFQTVSDCQAVSNPVVLNENSDGALISWDDNANAQSWTVEVGDENFVPGTNNFTQIYSNITDTTLVINGLNPNTDYSFHVRMVCSDTISDWSGKTLFSTTCPSGLTNLGGNQEICSNDFPIMLDAGADFVTYTWSPAGLPGTQTVTVESGGNYAVTITDSFGCSSSDSIEIFVNAVDTTQIAESICTGQSFSFFGSNLTGAGVYTHTLTNQQACDSIIELTLTVNPVYEFNLVEQICAGDSIDFFGTSIGESGSFQQVFTTAEGCDSTYTLNLSVIESTPIQFSDTICAGDTLIFGGQPLFEAGIYTDTLTSVSGCDSIVELQLMVNPVLTTVLNNTICEGDTLVFNNQNLTQGGNYSKILTASNGCDSIVELNLTVLPAVVTNLSEEICAGDTLQFFGTELTTSGIYEEILISSTGCDSIVQLDLTVLPIFTTALNESICTGDTLDFFGQSLSVTGIYTHTLTAQSGCDSIVELNLEVLQEFNTFVSDSICAGETFVFFDTILENSGMYSKVLTSSFGCDSIIHLELFVFAADTTILSETICSNEAYDFFGTNISTPGTYLHTLTAVFGCDSIIQLDIGINPVQNTFLQDSICAGDSLLFAGTELTASGIYTDTLIASNGCDSIVELHLTVLPAVVTNLSEEICAGDTLQFFGTELTTSGIYEEILISSTGCDSIVQLDLTVLPIFTTALNESICTGDTLDFFGQNLSETGIYTHILTAQSGCDSIVELNLEVLQEFNTFVSDSICAGETFVFFDTILENAGMYSKVLTSSFGCDSIIHLDLFVYAADTTVLTETICSNEAYDFFGTNISTPGTYLHTLTAVSGCDSIIQLDLSVSDLYSMLIQESICSGDTIEFYGSQYTEDGVYTHTIISENSCDTIVELHLSVIDVPEKPEISIVNEELQSSASEGNQWYVDGDEIAGATGEVLIPQVQNGLYTVVVTLNNCSSLPSEGVHVNWLSVIENQLQNIVVFPNPTDGIVRIEGILDDTFVQIYNAEGKLYDQFYKSNDFDIDLQTYPSGVYLMKLEANGKVLTLKIQRK